MSNEDTSLKQVVKPIYEQIESWDYEIQELPEKEKFMLDGVTPRVMVKGILQKAETLNQNKRVYPREILKREIDNYQKLIQEKRAFGELDHPEASVIELKNVSHVVRKTWWEGDDVYGLVEILNTPAGRVAREIINAGLTLGISSRGVGSTRNEGGVDVVQEDFMLICWDLVSEPSTPGAFLFKENKEGGLKRSLAENAFKNWGVDIKDEIYYDGLVKDQQKLNLCKNANSIIEFYNKIKG